MSENNQQTATHQQSIPSPSELPSSLSTPTSTNASTTNATNNNNITKTNSSTSESSPQPSSNKITKPSKKKSKKLCNYKNCSNPHSIIGDCSFCFKKYCTRHRLLEAHDCEHYRDVRNDYHERNAKQLQAQQTVTSKV